MTGWYAIYPTGPITLGNLTPVGQNSGLIGCRWPPNGHQLASCIGLPTNCQIWGPFWYSKNNLYLPLPLPVYTTNQGKQGPKNLYRMQFSEQGWQVRPEHQNNEKVEIVGGQYLIAAGPLDNFWKDGVQGPGDCKRNLVALPWQTLTLSRNHRENYEVREEGGFFAEMTTLLETGWAIALKIIGDYEPPSESYLGAKGTPVTIRPLRSEWNWLGEQCDNATGGILLTAALWKERAAKRSLPYPDFEQFPIKAYAADDPVPWQSWKKVPDQKNHQQYVTTLTPGEWLTPAGAVYLWDRESSPLARSGPVTDPYNRDALGYGHLLLFEE